MSSTLQIWDQKVLRLRAKGATCWTHKTIACIPLFCPELTDLSSRPRKRQSWICLVQAEPLGLAEAQQGEARAPGAGREACEPGAPKRCLQSSRPGARRGEAGAAHAAARVLRARACAPAVLTDLLSIAVVPLLTQYW